MKGAVLLVILSTLLASVGQVLYKFGANRLPELFTNWPLALGLAIYCVSGILTVVSLRFVELSIIFPLLATSFVWVSFLSVFIFHEVLSVANWLGIGIIVLGVLLLSKGAS